MFKAAIRLVILVRASVGLIGLLVLEAVLSEVVEPSDKELPNRGSRVIDFLLLFILKDIVSASSSIGESN